MNCRKWSHGEPPKTYDEFIKHAYTVAQLKAFSKLHKLPVSGNKPMLMEQLSARLFLIKTATVVQKTFRGYIRRLFNKVHGPAFLNRSLCTNDTDFVTLDELVDIEPDRFFSFADSDGFVYGFDVVSLRDFVCRDAECSNPYNRKTIPSAIINQLELFIGLSELYNVSWKSDATQLTDQQRFNARVLALFQAIDALGNYSDPQWFHSLNRNQSFRLMQQLRDIFEYRSQLTIEKQREICIAPFHRLRNLTIDDDLFSVKYAVLEVLEKFVYNGINHDARCLGALYVLTAFTLVNPSAAAAFPWLYQSAAIY
jgi:hypothetical protein